MKRFALASAVLVRSIPSALAIAMFVLPCPAYGELTVTEDLIRREIRRLGGDWELPSKPVLVGFLGVKFESKHFEMLTHLPSVTWFAAHECAIDHFALACVSQLRQLERFDINGCKLESAHLSLLRGNRELKTIYLQFIPVSDQLLTELATLKQIKNINFTDCEGLTDERLTTLKAALPDATISH